jgi:outer membrane protein
VAAVAIAGLTGMALLATATAAPAAAQAVKLAVIDVQRLVTDSVAGKASLATLKKLQDDKVAQGKTRQDEIEQLRKRLNEGRLSLADDKIAELEKQLEEKITAIRRFQEDAERELNKSRDAAFAEIERKVAPLIEQAGREGGYTLIFNKFQSGLVFAVETADITDQIIQRFDASAGTAAKGQ